VSWRRKRVLITGATGFIGQYLARQLRVLEATVYGSTSPKDGPDEAGPTEEQAALLRREQAALLRREQAGHPLAFDVRDARAVKSVVDSMHPQVVFHLAAVGVTNPGVDPMQALTVNAGGAINLLEALKGRNIERVVLVGTSYEYGLSGMARDLDPINAYAASKVAAWAFGRMYWRAYELPVVHVRPFQVYGPGQPRHTLIPAAMRAALSGEDFPMTPGEQKRDFIFAADIAEGMIAAAEAVGIEGESLDLGMGVGVTVRHVVERIWNLAEGEGRIRAGARAYRTGAPVHLVADASRTAQLIGWRAKTTLEEGLRTTMAQLTSEKRHSV
jgi:nucleoside-diphosphate-sugar epimerase